MSMSESDIEKIFKERDIKGFAIIADDHFVLLDVINKIIKIRISTSSLSTADRRIVRTDEMDRRIKKAAKSRAPHLRFSG